MSKRFANLSERLSADLPTDPTRPDEGEEDETTTSTDKDKEKKPMTTVSQEDHVAAVATAKAEGAKAERDRTNAVMASEHYAGRESLAASLLGDEACMSAESIIKHMAATPKIEPSALGSEIDTDSVQRQVMADAMAANKNSAIEAGGGDPAKADDADPMIRAAAKVNEINGLK